MRRLSLSTGKIGCGEETAGMRFERMRKPLKLVCDLKNTNAGDDLERLRDLVAEVGSNYKLDSRKVLLPM